MPGTEANNILGTEIRKMSLTGAGNTSGTGNALTGNWIDDTNVLEDLLISGHGNDGIQIQNSYDYPWDRLFITGNGGNGVNAQTAINADNWTNIVCFGNAFNGMLLNGVAGSNVVTFDCESNGQYGLMASNVYSLSISGGDWENNGVSSPGTYAAIYIVSTAGYSGVVISGVNITGTAGVTKNGIRFGPNCAGIVFGNSFNSMSDADILIDAGPSSVVIGLDNVRAGVGPAVIEDNGTGTRYPGVSSGDVPANSGYLAWNMSPRSFPVLKAPVAGQEYLMRIPVPNPGLITNIVVIVGVGGTGLSNCYLTLYDPVGNQFGISLDLSSMFTAPGVYAVPVTAGPSMARSGSYWGGLLIGAATTMPQFVSLNYFAAGSSLIANANQGSVPPWFATGGTGLTVPPSSIPPSPAPSTTFPTFIGVS